MDHDADMLALAPSRESPRGNFTYTRKHNNYQMFVIALAWDKKAQMSRIGVQHLSNPENHNFSNLKRRLYCKQLSCFLHFFTFCIDFPGALF